MLFSMSDRAVVTIEERDLGEERWGVFIQRPTHFIPRSLWGRFTTQEEAQQGADAAREYLRERGEA